MFDILARFVERAAASPWTFLGACLLVLAWAASGPMFDWSTTWQLVINTGTTIITFLMVFLIQATQSRDTAALHLKLDELIRVTGAARNEMIVAENLSVEELEGMRRDIQRQANDGDDAGSSSPGTGL